MQVKGTVFNIQRYTINDGPGIRTEIFLKGCNLDCPWCSNPESKSTDIEVGVYPSRCIGKEQCGYCADICPQGCIRFSDGVVDSIDRDKCTACMKCVEACPSVALKAWGADMTVDEVLAVIKKDIPYFRNSGGVTLSGGEPLMQSEFAARLLAECKKLGIHTCVESALDVESQCIDEVLPYTDLFIADLKIMDPLLHIKHIGYSNARILSNFEYLSKKGVSLIIRIPIIPFVNDNTDNAEKTADFICDKLGGAVITVQLLKYMPLGEEKYRSLDKEYLLKGLSYNKKTFDSKVLKIQKCFLDRNIRCTIGTTTKEKQE